VVQLVISHDPTVQADSTLLGLCCRSRSFSSAQRWIGKRCGTATRQEWPLLIVLHNVNRTTRQTAKSAFKPTHSDRPRVLPRRTQLHFRPVLHNQGAHDTPTPRCRPPAYRPLLSANNQAISSFRTARSGRISRDDFHNAFRRLEWNGE
jgi:hypothetical protein